MRKIIICILICVSLIGCNNHNSHKKNHQVTIKVIDEKGKPISCPRLVRKTKKGFSSNIIHIADENGVITMDLHQGNNIIEVTKEGYKENLYQINVKDKDMTVKIVMSKKR